MRWARSATVAVVLLSVAVAVAGPATGAVSNGVTTGDVSATSVPRPPSDPGSGDPITRALFTTPDGSISCRRVYSENVWLECLVRDTREIVRFGPAESYVEAPCKAPNQGKTCRMGYGDLSITPAAKSDAARFAGARRVPLERLIQLGKQTMPYPMCIADPNLGLSCSTAMDDSVGEQVYLGLAGSVWNCPGYEYISAKTPVAKGSDRCLVVRS